jgi:hypothetical protein
MCVCVCVVLLLYGLQLGLVAHQAHALKSGGESDARRALDRAVAEARDTAAAEAERRAAGKLAEVGVRCSSPFPGQESVQKKVTMHSRIMLKEGGVARPSLRCLCSQ